MSGLVETTGLIAHYGDAQVLFGIDFRLDATEIVAVIGANGAGKSTFLKALTGLVRVLPDSVRLRGRSIGGTAPGAIVRQGVAMVPEGRRLFPSLSLEENLLMGAFAKRSGPWNLQKVYGLFPVLQEYRLHAANALSGGQQQMVAIGRALMTNPEVLLCDELSLGLAPIIIKEIYEALPSIAAGGMSIVIVEQDVLVAQRVSNRIYCFQEGRVSLDGLSLELSREQLSEAYFGI